MKAAIYASGIFLVWLVLRFHGLLVPTAAPPIPKSPVPWAQYFNRETGEITLRIYYCCKWHQDGGCGCGHYEDWTVR